MTQLSKQQIYDVLAGGGVKGELARIMAGGSHAESGWDTEATGDIQADGTVCSWSLFQINRCGGLGVGYSEAELRDPAVQVAIMRPVYEAQYDRYQAEGWTGAELAVRVCLAAERPFGWMDPTGPAAQGYRRGYEAAAPDGDVPMNALVEQWIAAMKALAGTPYVFGGKDVARDGGLDCSGLVTSTARAVGLDLGDPDMTSADGLKAYCDPVAESAVQRGDIVLFSQTYGDGGPDYATHVGVWLSPGRMIDTHDGVHETNLYEPYWQQHLMGFWRPLGLAGDGENGGEDMARIAELETIIGEMQRVATEEVLPNLSKALGYKLPKAARDALEAGALPAAQTITRAGAEAE